MPYETLLAGAYHVEKTLDRSTYSVFCVGKQASTGQAVRLRLWPAAHVNSAEEQQRIQAEVAAIQNVQHPHLLPILEVRATGQGVLLASASVQDGSLDTRLNRHFLKPLPLAEALLIIKQVGQALHALHEHGIIHGNLTPLAIFFSESDHVRLGECYLQSIPQSIQGYQPLLDENIPRCWYMAPEQFSGHLNVQTDLYALGCLAYTMLTGRVPFAGSARVTILHKHQHEQPRSLIALNAAVPTYVETAVLKALAKLPAERHSSVQAFLQALEEEAVSLPVSTLPEEVVHTSVDVQPTTEEVICTPEDIQVEAEKAVQIASPGLEKLDASQARADLALLKRVEGEPTNIAAPVPQARRVLRTRQTVLGPPSDQTTGARGLTMLAPMIALVLVIVLVLGSWFALTGGKTLPQITGGITPSSTQGAQATATNSLRPTTVETVNAIGVHYATPTVGPTGAPSPTSAPTATPTAPPTTVPTATPTASPAVVSLLPVCITPSQGGAELIAEFGYANNGNAPVTIPVGSNNFTFASSDPQPVPNPPTSFSPGTNAHAFQVQFPNSRRTAVTWSLNGRSMTASRNSSMC